MSDLHVDATGGMPRPYDDLVLRKPSPGSDLRAPLRSRLVRHGQFGPDQLAGRLFPTACVALEVTQRCNLDCTLCYLSDLAEAVQDPPLSHLLDKVARIHQQFGPNTNIQITGGDPTLRPIADLEAIVRRIRTLGMRSALFTNGIKATREMLARLAVAGLNDVCFHVDNTQQRKGFETEAQLHSIRAEYLERVQGLGLRVNFNTTVHAGNIGELVDLVRWFTANASRVNLASFQMQAEIGRGVLGARDDEMITQQGLMDAIKLGTGGTADFDVFAIGHHECNRHCSVLVAGDCVAPLYGESSFYQQLFTRLAAGTHDWNRDRDVFLAALRILCRAPRLLPRGIQAAFRTLKPLLPALLSGHRAHRLSFFIHNFMAAEHLDRARCEACVFQVMTDRGPLSMCAHNADRDAYTLGDLDADQALKLRGALAFKHLKGRLRARAAARRAKKDPGPTRNTAEVE
ncbi:MAG: radical SAM protein [Pseudomonadota bacterium]